MDYLVFWVTCDGAKTIDLKTEAIKIWCHQIPIKLRQFIGLVNDYHGMC